MSLFAARDRADETVDRIRSVRSARFKYIRNHYPGRPYRQPNRYMDDKAIVQALRRLHAAGKIRPVIYRAWPLAEAPAALAALGSRKTHGKVVLHP